MTCQESANYIQDAWSEWARQQTLYQEQDRHTITEISPIMSPKLSPEIVRINHKTWMLKLNGNVENETHHMMWFFESSEALLEALLAANVKMLVIDLTKTERVDSNGLRRLFKARQEFTKKNIEIVLQNPNPHLSRLLRIMQFDRIFRIEFKED